MTNNQAALIHWLALTEEEQKAITVEEVAEALRAQSKDCPLGCDDGWLDGHGWHGPCPRCELDMPDVDEDPRYRDCEGDPVVPEMREYYERRKVNAEKS